MRILAIETSCDETAIAILEGSGDEQGATFTVLGNALLSQIETHAQYGGVFPALAKREHTKNIVPLLRAALEEAELMHESAQSIVEEKAARIAALFTHETELVEPFLELIREVEPPSIDAIAVTAGPGLEPALWVGVNTAKALALAWDKPIVAVNHMEGHILAGLMESSADTLMLPAIPFPLVSLLISGGHTELVLSRELLSYELLGETRDDAVGEAFDKVARMLALPYPGGPQISKLAEAARKRRAPTAVTLPRPMIADNTCDFSFSGLKTAVLYLIKANPGLADSKEEIAHEFENAVTEVLWKKTSLALEEHDAHGLVLGGGVSANTHIRRTFGEKMKEKHPEVLLRIPAPSLTTDNAIMIGAAGYFRAKAGRFADSASLRADGTLSLAA